MTDEPLVARFRDAMAKLVPEFPDSDDLLGLAVSGGPDSLALLLLAHSGFPGRIAAATVDHGLRPEAHAEAEMVGATCSDHQIPHQILRPSVPIRGNIQSEARRVRYGLFRDWVERENIAWLATAHHADDQLETLVMRILRGSGIDGLSAIRARRGDIVRPLLDFTKDELIQFVRDKGLSPVDDPSNRDQSFDRVRVREALSRLEGFDVSLAGQSAAALGDARAALDWMIDGLTGEHITVSCDGCTLDKQDFPHEITRRLLLKCLHICDPALSPRGEQLERTIAALSAGETVTLGNILCKGGESWSFEPAPKRHKS